MQLSTYIIFQKLKQGTFITDTMIRIFHTVLKNKQEGTFIPYSISIQDPRVNDLTTSLNLNFYSIIMYIKCEID